MDSYKTISGPGQEVLFKEKGSKFFGYALPVTAENEVAKGLEDIRTRHHSARHHCYAWALGPDRGHFRANDDGEPSNSAGKPILGQIQAHNLTDILVVVVRYFGGTKLGVGGLIQAYKQAAAMAIEASTVVIRELTVSLRLKFDYSELSEVERLLRKHDLEVISRKLTDRCRVEIRVNRSKVSTVVNWFEPLHKVDITQSS